MITSSELLAKYALGTRNFRGVYLPDADLAGADLSDARLINAILTRTNLRGADLAFTDLSGASLRDADLSDACLMRTNLAEANLAHANLSRANLRGAHLAAANLICADLTGAQLPHFQIPAGDLVGYKKVQHRLVELLIPARARRTACLINRKCRAEFALVREIEGHATVVSDRGGTYSEGKEIWPNRYCDDIRTDYAPGVHFFLTRAEAGAW